MPIPADELEKALFKAGKTRDEPADMFVILGSSSARQQDLLDATEVIVRVGTAAEPDLFEDTIPAGEHGIALVSNQTGLKFAGGPGRVTLSSKLTNGKFALVGTALDLSDLSTPVRLEISFGSYQGIFTLEEDLINGPKRFIPMQYLSGRRDALRVEKKPVRVKVNDKTGAASVTIQGAIALGEGDIDLSEAGASVTVSWDGFAETIPPDGGSISKKKGSRYSYRRPKGMGSCSITRADLDFDKATFKIIIKDAVLQTTGQVSFGVRIVDKNEVQVFDEAETIDLSAP